MNGTPLPDEVVTETTLRCAAPDCRAELTLTATLGPEVYDLYTDVPDPVSIHWYTTSGEMSPLQYVSATPEPLTANLVLEGERPHDVFVAARGWYETSSFRQIVIHLVIE